jgi:hypothetical protein
MNTAGMSFHCAYAGCPPEERLRSVAEEQALLALPVSALRHLPEDYPPVPIPSRAAGVRERIARGR